MKRAPLGLVAVTLAFCLCGCSRIGDKDFRAAYVTTGGGNARAGRAAIRRYGCNACHDIPGVDGARGLVGPPLGGIGTRQYIAGELPNNAANLMRWIQHPHSVEAHTAMPEMGVTDDDSRNIAAYLYTLKDRD